MKKSFRITAFSSTVILIVSCATTPTVSELDSAISDGGNVVSPIDLIGDSGVTYIAQDGAWFNYLSADGKKVVKLNDTGLIKELTWRVSDTGEFCQEMFATEKEECDNTIILEIEDGVFNSFNKDDGVSGSPFEVARGNSENL